MRGTQDREVAGSVLKELKQYVDYHFRTEESMMKLHNYPNINEHKMEHESAILKVNKLALDHERGIEVDIELLKFLSDWIQNHILLVDRKYIPYVQGKV